MVNKKISSKIKNKIGTDVESGVMQMTTRLPVALANRIKQDVEAWNSTHQQSPETRSDRMAYLLQYAYDAGNLNHFIDLMKAQYLEILATTPKQLAEGVATFNQQNTINYRLNDIDDKLDRILQMLTER